MSSLHNYKQKYFLKAGELVLFDEYKLVYTILGSCVSVIFWDRFNKIGGMNHYLMPIWKERGEKSLKYGDVSIRELYNKILRAGARRENLKAMIFGGSNMLNLQKTGIHIGDQNVEIAWQVVTELNVPVISDNTGGIKGRKIQFDANTGTAKMELIIY